MFITACNECGNSPPNSQYTTYVYTQKAPRPPPPPPLDPPLNEAGGPVSIQILITHYETKNNAQSIERNSKPISSTKQQQK